MNTTNELPPPTLEEKIDHLTELVIAFRDGMTERLDKVEEDSRLRYVDLRQRVTEMESRLTERIDGLEERQKRMEQEQTEMRQETRFLVKAFHTIDKKLDNLVDEFHLWKEKVRLAQRKHLHFGYYNAKLNQTLQRLYQVHFV